MIKQLPFEINPIITVYNHHAYPLGILCSDPHNKIEWICQNYIQLYFTTDPKHTKFNFCMIDARKWNIFDYQIIDKQYILDNSIDMKSFIIQTIDKKRYLMTTVDEYYIPYMNSYNSYHHTHDMLIYGYDLANNYFYIAGYNNGRYTSSKIDMNVLVNAICNVNNDDIMFEDFNTLVCIKKRYDIDLQINIKLVVQLLEDYINSYNTYSRYILFINPIKKEEYTFGINACNRLVSYLYDICENESYVDLRYPKVLLEHKKCMIFRMEYLCKYGACDQKIIKKYECIVNDMNTAFNLLLKHSLTHKKDNLKKAISIIQLLIKKEKEILGEFILFLQKYC